MFQLTPNCKKCPMQEQATVAFYDNPEQTQALESIAPELDNLTNPQFSPQADIFFEPFTDDRSTCTIHPARWGFLLSLLFTQFLSQTPGIGSTQSMSEFVISEHELASQSTGLKLTEDIFASPNYEHRQATSIR